MRKWLMLSGACLILAGCASNEEAISEVKADTQEEVTSVQSPESYYQNRTHPAMVDIMKQFDYLLDTYSETISDSEYDPEYAATVFKAMITDYEELSAVVDELPVKGLDADQSEINEFKVNSKLANDYRIKYAETLIEGIGVNGISRESSDEAMEHLETSGDYSVESLEYLKAYELRKGY